MRNRRVLLFLGLNYYVFVKNDVILIGIEHFLVVKIHVSKYGFVALLYIAFLSQLWRRQHIRKQLQ